MTTYNTIALFDFDGTITHMDTFKSFLLYRFGIVSFCLGILKNFKILAAYSGGLVSNHQAKERLFGTFYGTTAYCDFQRDCRYYSLERIDRIIRPEARSKLDWHRKEGHQVVIVSASICDWIVPWAARNGVHEVIATKPEVVDGVLTGRFATTNCYGSEKKTRFLERYPERASYTLYVYGDSRGDAELLAMADFPFYRCFNV